MRESEYRKHQEGNWTVFDVTPAEEPKFMLMVVGGAVLVVFFFWMILTIPVGIWAFWKGWSGKIRPKEHQSPSNFRVSSDVVESNGRTFRKDDIHQLTVRNGLKQTGLPGGVMAPASAGLLRGMAHREKCSTIAYSLDVESGGKAYSLAGGMDETTANGLLHDVSKALGMEVR